MYCVHQTIRRWGGLQQSEPVPRAICKANACDVRVRESVPTVGMADPSEPGYSPDVLEREEVEVKEPDMFLVVLHNDDYTTMDFVVEVLVKVFQKDLITAMKIMFDVHRKGRGEVGRYTHDIAKTKVDTVHRMAQEREFPLKCTMEPA